MVSRSGSVTPTLSRSYSNDAFFLNGSCVSDVIWLHDVLNAGVGVVSRGTEFHRPPPRCIISSISRCSLLPL